jgi:sugar phosphate permease
LKGLIASLRRFWTLSIAAAFVGFCLVTIIVWLPTYYVEVAGVDIGLASSLAALIPFAGIAGALLIGWLVGHFFSSRETTGLMLVLFLLALLFFIFPFLPDQLVVSTLALMLIGAVVYGASSLTLTTMPLSLGEQEEASSTAGLIDFSLNIGGGLSGIAVGAILQSSGWDFTFLALAVAALFGALFVGVTARRL